jgi:hypothetical protein
MAPLPDSQNRSGHVRLNGVSELIRIGSVAGMNQKEDEQVIEGLACKG